MTLVPTSRGGVPPCAVPGCRPHHLACMFRGCQKRPESHRHGMEQRFTQRKDRARSASIVSIGPLWPEGSTLPPRQGDGLNTLFLCSRQRTTASSRYSSGVSYMPPQHRQNKDVHIKSGTGKGSPKQGNMPSTGSEDSLCPRKEMFQNHSGTLLCKCAGVSDSA